MAAIMNEIKITHCKYCSSNKIIKFGATSKKRERYYCNACGRTFTPDCGEKRGKKSIEGLEAKALWQWAQLNPITRDFLIRQEWGFKTISEARRIKSEGGRKGISDYFLAYPVKYYAGLWIELKAPKPYSSKISTEQQQWIDKMRSNGYAACVAYGWVEASEKIMIYLKGCAV